MSGPYGYYIWPVPRTGQFNTSDYPPMSFDPGDRRKVVGYLLSNGVPFHAALTAVDGAYAYEGSTCYSATMAYTVAFF